MRETRSSGSVEGVVSNHDPYSDSGESVGRVSAIDVHGAGCGSGSGESGERMASVGAGRTTVAMERQALAQRDGLRTAAPAAPDDRPPMPQKIPAPKGRNLCTNGERRLSISR